MDRLDAAYRNLLAEIQDLEERLQQLRARVRVLDDARTLVAEQLSSGEEARLRAAVIEPLDERLVPGLQDEVHRTLRVLSRVSESGYSAAQIAAAMRNNSHPNSNSKAFYASVYSTLMRLYEKGAIAAQDTDSGRRFRDLDRTRLLFDPTKPGPGARVR